MELLVASAAANRLKQQQQRQALGGEVELDDTDPTRSACCIRDEEDAKKAADLRSILRKVDPVRKAEDLRRNAANVGFVHDMACLDHANCSCTSKAESVGFEKQQDNFKDNSEDAESDFDDEEFDEIFQQFCISKKNEMMQRSLVTQLEDINTFRQVLFNNNKNILCLLYDERTNELLNSRLTEHLLQLSASHKDLHFYKLAVPSSAITETVNIIKLFKTENAIFPREYPLILANHSMKQNQLHLLTCEDLQLLGSSDVAIDALMNRFIQTFKSLAAIEEEEDRSERIRFKCNRAGCMKSFHHEHIISKDKYEDASEGYF